MATRDFIEDAMEILDKDENLNFIFIGGYPNTITVLRRAKIHNQKQMEWYRRRFDEFYEVMMKELPK